MKSYLTGDLHRAHGDSVTTPEDERMARAPMHRARGQRAEAGKAGTAVGTYAPARAGTAFDGNKPCFSFFLCTRTRGDGMVI